MVLDWNALLVALVGVLGYAFKAIVDAIRQRYVDARNLRLQRESEADKLKRKVFEWREHAYIVRMIAIEQGCDPSDLPEVPEE